ncbi:hypothetical protein ACLOJK_003947 [Asimina triloba]
MISELDCPDSNNLSFRKLECLEGEFGQGAIVKMSTISVSSFYLTLNFPCLLQGPYRNQLAVCKAQVNEVSVEKSLNNSAASPPTNLEIPSSDNKDTDKDAEPAAGNDIADASISAFMSEVASLVKIVDSRDIVELHLKQQDCELVIRKKEALPQPPVTVIQMPSPAPHTMLPQLPANAFMPPPAPASAPTPPPPAPATSAPALPAPAKSSSSSLPLIKCPMAGTFYRCPAPGEPPFVQVGDKVQKGKILCIVEAMKLMNEIEADQSGTIVEILAEDGKPVSIDTEFFRY